MTKPSEEKPERGRIYIKEWRKYRGMTQEQLAEAAGMVVSNVSQLEQGRQGYSQEGLEAIANALQCGAGQLLSSSPSGDAERPDDTNAKAAVSSDICSSMAGIPKPEFRSARRRHRPDPEPSVDVRTGTAWLRTRLQDRPVIGVAFSRHRLARSRMSSGQYFS